MDKKYKSSVGSIASEKLALGDMFNEQAAKKPISQFNEKNEAVEESYFQVYMLEMEALIPFGIKGIPHPFKQYDESRMQELSESIKTSGVLNPIIVRPAEGNSYEIIAGHNRVEAAKRAGLARIPALIRQVDDDTAAIMMVDSNLRQRDKLLPSEKAFAYKIKLDAMKRQGMRNDLTCAQDEHKFTGKKSRDMIAEESGDSRAQVVRYIRLTYLIPALLEKVDQGSLPLVTAVSLSYLDEQQQNWLLDEMEREQIVPSAKQALRLKELSEQRSLDESTLRDQFTKPEKQQSQVIFRQPFLQKYFPATFTPKQIEQVISELLENWKRNCEVPK